MCIRYRYCYEHRFVDKNCRRKSVYIFVSIYTMNVEYHTCTCTFYPKIHKELIPALGRTVVSANGCPTENISKFVDHFLNTLFTHNKSYVKGVQASQEALEKFLMFHDGILQKTSTLSGPNRQTQV